MPVDLDTQLRALGDALVRESEPITLDELGTGDVIATPPAPTRRRWASVAAIATAAAAIVGIVVVGQPDDARRPGTVAPAPSSAPELTDPPTNAPPLIGVTSFPLVDDPVAVGLAGSPEATFAAYPVSAAGPGVRNMWATVLGRPAGDGYGDVVSVSVETGLPVIDGTGHVSTRVVEHAAYTEYTFEGDGRRTTIQADEPADVAESIRAAIRIDPTAGAGFAFDGLPVGFEEVTQPFGMTADSGRFPVLAFGEGVTIAVNPVPAAGLLVRPGETMERIVIAGRPSYVSEGGGQVDLASELDDGTTLQISAAGMSMDQVVALAEAVQLVDQRSWIERYQPRWVDEVGNTVDLPAPITVPADTVPPTTRLAPSVAEVQQRLADLGFDPGPVDGVFGTMTQQAVWAFEKLVMGVPREQVSAVVTPETWQRMQEPVVITPWRPQDSGVDHVEIHLPEQVMVVFHDDVAVLVTHISTGELDESGEPATWCETLTVDTDHNGSLLDQPEETAICGRSKTPGGIFDVDRFVPGTRVGPLGAMWNPIYFNHGIAIHGARNVPLEPASHGNVRVPMHVSERLPELIDVGDAVYVWDGKKEPEDQTREDELPVFDWPDPDAVTP